MTRSEPLRLGIVGSGDVALRSYIPALSTIRSLVQVAGISDFDEDRARYGALACGSWSPGAQVFTDYEQLLALPGLDAILNLTPVAAHAAVSLAALGAGLHVLSEKPIAISLEETDDVIAAAKEADRLLLVAPGVAATPLIKWLRQIIRHGPLGHVTVATANMGGLGPAAWRDYSGDPAWFYGHEVGPITDQGVYLLHALTALLGPVRRLQALSGITIPQRVSVARNSIGMRIPVGSSDVALLNLEFSENRFAQVFSSFASPATKCPQLEVHLVQGTISVSNIIAADATADIYTKDPSPVGLDGWLNDLTPPGTDPAVGTVGRCAVHFANCLLGREEPLLTAAHSRHVFEVINAAKSLTPGNVAEFDSSF